MRATTEQKTVEITKNTIIRKSLAAKIENGEIKGQMKVVAKSLMKSGKMTLGELVAAVAKTIKTKQSPERVARYYVSILKTHKFAVVR